MLPRTLLLDLGGTLIDLFGHTSPGQILPRSLEGASQVVTKSGFNSPSAAVLESRWEMRRQDPNDTKVRPLEDRLSFTFDIDSNESSVLFSACRAFMRPLFAQTRVFEDTFPLLHHARAHGIRTVIVSNTTWGSPATLWRELLERIGLSACIDASVFCRDVGRRKPDPMVYAHAMDVAGTPPEGCLFVGDNPVWDVEGPQRMGIRSVLLDRRAEWIGQGYERTTSLIELRDLYLS
jgi:FMN phosphatase YigB (HAD superfamily)